MLVSRAGWLILIALSAGCIMPPTSGTSGGTGGGAASTTTTADTDAGADAPAACDMIYPGCPPGTLSACESVDMPTTPCCQGETVVQACSTPSGILTHVDCKTQNGAPCPSGVCAVSLGGSETCCAFGTPDDPCAISRK